MTLRLRLPLFLLSGARGWAVIDGEQTGFYLTRQLPQMNQSLPRDGRARLLPNMDVVYVKVGRRWLFTMQQQRPA